MTVLRYHSQDTGAIKLLRCYLRSGKRVSINSNVFHDYIMLVHPVRISFGHGDQSDSTELMLILAASVDR